MTYGKVFSNDFCSDNALKKKKIENNASRVMPDILSIVTIQFIYAWLNQ